MEVIPLPVVNQKLLDIIVMHFLSKKMMKTIVYEVDYKARDFQDVLTYYKPGLYSDILVTYRLMKRGQKIRWKLRGRH